MRRALSFTRRDGAAAQAQAEGPAPAEKLAVLLQRVEAGDPPVVELPLNAHPELRTLIPARQCDTIARLQRSRALTGLDVSALQLDDAAARALASLLAPAGAPPLVWLYAERNNFGDVGVLAICDALCANARLAELSLADQSRPIAQKVAAQFCAMLERNQTLCRLNLGRFVDPANTLGQRFSRLTSRNEELARKERNAVAVQNAASEVQAAEAGARAAHQDRIDWLLEASRLADSLPPHAARLGGRDGEGRLQLDLSRNVLFERASGEAKRGVLAALGPNRTIEHADLGGVGLGDAELVVLARALEANRTLASLSLERNQIAMGADASAALCAALRANSTLRKLRLAEQSKPWSRAAEESLADAVYDNRALLVVTHSFLRSSLARERVERGTRRNQQAQWRAPAEQAVGAHSQGLPGAPLGVAQPDEIDGGVIAPRAERAAPGERAQLAASGERAQPAAPGEDTQPAASDERAQPAAPGEDTQPAASDERAQPAAPGEDTQPAAPGTSGEHAQPAESKQRARPALSGQRIRALRRPTSEHAHGLDAVACAPRESAPDSACVERSLAQPPAPPALAQVAPEPAAQPIDLRRVRRTSPARRRFAQINRLPGTAANNGEPSPDSMLNVRGKAEDAGEALSDKYDATKERAKG